MLTSSTELLDGLLPVLICAPPESPSEEPRKIYYQADGTDDNAKPAEVPDNRRTTRSAGATSSTSSKAPAKKSSSAQPQKRPEIHLFSSKSRIAENSDNEIIELPPPDHGTKSHSKKRALPDIDEVIEMEETRGKRASLRSLYDSDENEKTVAKKVKKSATKKVEASAARANDKGAARGKRGGRAGGRGGKPGRVVKSKVVITDSDTDPEVPASDPMEAPLAPRPRPKPKPAYKTASSIVTETVENPTSASTALDPPTDTSMESSLTASETSTYPSAPLASQQAPILQGMHDIVSSTMANPIPSVTNTQVASSGLPQTLVVASAASAPNPIPSATNVQVASSGPSQTSTVAAAPFAAPLQGDIFEGGLPPAGGGPQSQTTWDPRLPYTDSMMQHNTRGYTGYRGPRLDHAGREPLRLQSRPPSEDRWGVAGHHDNYHNQDRRRGYQEVMWDGSHRDEYREVRRGGRDGPGWDAAGQEEYREVRRMGRDEGGWAMGGRYDVRRLPEARQMGWEPPREDIAHYGAAFDTTDYGDPHYSQGPAVRLPNSTYPDDTPFDNNHDYLHPPPPPPPPSRSSNTSTSPFGFQAELQQMIPNALAAPDNTI